MASAAGSPKSPEGRLSAVLRPEGPRSTAPLPSSPKGVRPAIVLCGETSGLPKVASCLIALPLSANSRRCWLPVACVGHPRVLSAGESLRLLRGAASPPCVPLPERRLVQSGLSPPLPSPKSEVLLSLRPIGSSEEDPAFMAKRGIGSNGSDEVLPFPREWRVQPESCTHSQCLW